MAGPTYASASYGETAPSLKAALSRLAALFIMAMRRFIRYTLNEENSGPDFLTASRGSTSDIIPLDQSRTADYQAFFIEDLIRLGKFHMVGSFRLDHENVEVDSAARAVASDRASHWAAKY